MCWIISNIFLITVNECPDLSIESENNSCKNSLLKIISNGKRIGDSITFLCPLGYDLIGSKEMTCLETGQWSDAIPFCEGMNKLVSMITLHYSVILINDF